MKRRITLEQHVFEIRTEDWPFADDERLCLDLAESELKTLAREGRVHAARLAADLEAGHGTDVVAAVLARAWQTAAKDYEFGVNEFECVLEVTPVLARVVRVWCRPDNGNMAGTYDYFLTDSLDDARVRLADILRQNGFAAEPSPNGGLVASRGNATRTLLLGGLAGKGMHMRFDVQFFDDSGRVVARLSRDLAAGALKGGLIGASRTASVFDELASRVGAALTEAGVLAETKAT